MGAGAACAAHAQLFVGSSSLASRVRQPSTYEPAKLSAAMFCLSDFEKYARTRLDGNAWGYYSSGANQEQTLRDNEEAFRR